MTSDNRQRLLLGIDVGGSKTVAVVARAHGEILAESRLDDWSGGDWRADLATLTEQGRALLREADVDPKSLDAVGLSLPGPLDALRGRVIDAPNLAGWVDVPIVEQLAQEFGVPIHMENDANAAALAEWRFGAGRGTQSLIYLTMSTGLGAGLVLDGHLYHGATFQAGEIGHMPVVPEGRLCNCGLRGCLEAYVGGAALAEMIREDLAQGAQSSIAEHAGGDPARISARHWVAALREQDGYALALRERFLAHLAQGIAILVQTFDPECIALGTIVQRNTDLFLDDLVRAVRERTWPSLHHVRIVAGELGARLPAYAALSAASPDWSPEA